MVFQYEIINKAWLGIHHHARSLYFFRILQVLPRPLSYYTIPAISYYFGKIPYLLKQRHPLIIPQKISCILLDGTKQLFSENEKHKKRACKAPYHFSTIFLSILPYTIWRNPYTFWQKNPRTEVHSLPNVKMPLKTQENNVSFRPM